MISIICLTWIGMQLNASNWYFALLIIGAILKIFSFGWDMYKQGLKDK